MEEQHDYKPRAAPYNSMMQYFINTKCDREKCFAYYERMQSRGIAPTMHTYKLLIDAYGSLAPTNFAEAEGVFDAIRAAGLEPEAQHYASLIHAKGCAHHDVVGARLIFDKVMAQRIIRPQANLYQSLIEAINANPNAEAQGVPSLDQVVQHMTSNGVDMTAYIANNLVSGWAKEGRIEKAENIYATLSKFKREPSTYEAMTKALLRSGLRQKAVEVVNERMRRGYPVAVTQKVQDLLGSQQPAVL